MSQLYHFFGAKSRHQKHGHRAKNIKGGSDNDDGEPYG